MKKSKFSEEPITKQSDERWTMDVTPSLCGQDGWAHLAAVIDCHDRKVIGYEFALRSRAQEAERALEAACLTWHGSVPCGRGAPVLRKRQRPDHSESPLPAACRDSRLQQEFITP
ncbi:hypothetical protein W02_10710 [Nitrospira sp. KM1]|uniref:DDE-type integrase/transposase/recombinase n=1 Tax=Nitrospira sp. KM1 TaxID=1936990 RepID=UPI0013A774A4|nr:DDE-type integrase/transposase/recombinase [Nitrospira sp. KM1]BCA53931.1 hypothetical protein W02_10710 [Nitrospira sp. KM1]